MDIHGNPTRSEYFRRRKRETVCQSQAIPATIDRIYSEKGERERVIEDPPICVFPATEARDCASELSDSGDNRPELATLRSPQASTMRQPRSQSVEIATPRSAGDGGEEDDHRRGRGER